jgi:voltage-gated potassium channel
LKQVDQYVARRALLVMLGLSCVTIFGTLGYMVIEGWSFSDALYMTTITISTV